MNKSWRPGRSDPTRQGDQPGHFPPRDDPAHHPAYSSQLPYPPPPPAPYGSPYPPPGPIESGPTERFPQYGQQYWHQGGAPGEPPSQTPPPKRPKAPRWLWIVAAAAVLLAVALVVTLVIANSVAKQPTAVPPLPAMPGSGATAPATTTPSSPAGTSAPTGTGSAGAMQSVVYDVTGQGHAISISYVDTGGVRETEFNVVLPWSKEVSLSTRDTASVTIINIGHDVTCSVKVAGVQVRTHTGAGLTICNAAR